MKIEEYKKKGGIDSKELPRPELVCDKDLQGIPYPLAGHDCSHFAMIVSGKPKSGKSTLALGMMTAKGKKKVYRGKFDHIIIFVPPHSLSSLKDNPFEDLGEGKKYGELNLDNLEKVYDKIKKNADAGESTLLYLDDMASDLKQSMRVQEIFNRICFNRRHLKCSVMFLVQTWKSIPINCRKTASHIILFKNFNKLENIAVFEEVLFLPQDTVEQLFDYVYDEKHNFLYIDVNNGLFFKNFNQLKLSDI